MSLSLEQLELIKLIDNKVKAVILNGGSEEDILISLLDKMPTIKTIINSFANLKIAEENGGLSVNLRFFRNCLR